MHFNLFNWIQFVTNCQRVAHIFVPRIYWSIKFKTCNLVWKWRVLRRRGTVSTGRQDPQDKSGRGGVWDMEVEKRQLPVSMSMLGLRLIRLPRLLLLFAGTGHVLSVWMPLKANCSRGGPQQGNTTRVSRPLLRPLPFGQLNEPVICTCIHEQQSLLHFFFDSALTENVF